MAEQAGVPQLFSEAMTHVQLAGQPDEEHSAQQTLCAALGVEGDTPLAEVGFIPASDFHSALASWTIGDPPAPPSALLKGKAAIILKMAQIIAGTLPEQQAASSNETPAQTIAQSISTAIVPVLQQQVQQQPPQQSSAAEIAAAMATALAPLVENRSDSQLASSTAFVQKMKLTLFSFPGRRDGSDCH